MNDEVFDLMCAWIGEHTGTDLQTIEAVLEAEQDFWEAHPTLANEILEKDA